MKTGTWNSLGNITARIAARLARREEIQGAVDAAPGEKKPVRGSAGSLPAAEETPDVMAAGVLGKSAQTIQGRNMVWASATDREEKPALIVGLKARHELKFCIVAHRHARQSRLRPAPSGCLNLFASVGICR